MHVALKKEGTVRSIGTPTRQGGCGTDPAFMETAGRSLWQGSLLACPLLMANLNVYIAESEQHRLASDISVLNVLFI